MDVSITEAAALSNRSLRQVARWIESHKVTAHKDKLGRWRIDLASIEALTAVTSDALDTVGQKRGVTLLGLVARIDVLEATILQRIEALEHRDSHMTRRAQVPATISIDYPLPTYSPLIVPTDDPLIVMNGLPPGTITQRDMAKRHTYNPGTLKSQMDNRPDLVTGIDQGNGRKWRYHTPAQQAGIIDMWRRGSKVFRPCGYEECACMH